MKTTVQQEQAIYEERAIDTTATSKINSQNSENDLKYSHHTNSPTCYSEL